MDYHEEVKEQPQAERRPAYAEPPRIARLAAAVRPESPSLKTNPED
jgi:hypothetical protein